MKKCLVTDVFETVVSRGKSLAVAQRFLRIKYRISVADEVAKTRFLFLKKQLKFS